MNCWVWPALMDGFTGVTTIPTSGFLFTVSPVELLTDPNAALMVTLPNWRPVASPALLMETVFESDDVQVTSDVRS